jgi:hypothetical protein
VTQLRADSGPRVRVGCSGVGWLTLLQFQVLSLGHVCLLYNSATMYMIGGGYFWMFFIDAGCLTRSRLSVHQPLAATNGKHARAAGKTVEAKAPLRRVGHPALSRVYCQESEVLPDRS